MITKRSTYRRFLYEKHRQKRRRSFDLSGTAAQRLAQAIATLKPFIVRFEQVGAQWKLEARDRAGRKRIIVNATRIACLTDLATLLGYKT